MTQHFDGAPYPLGSLLLYAEQEFDRSCSPMRGSGYVIESDSGLEAMRCINVHDNVATFVRPGGAMTRVVQYCNASDGPSAPGVPRIVGNIFASITPLP